jgi:arylsulfatase A-like enzyme
MCWISSILATLFLLMPPSATAASRPNFVFIFCDDLGWGDLPAYGHRNVDAHGGWTVRGKLHMPNLDRMSTQGIRFTQFYVASGVCSPSRAGVMTGRFPSELGIHDYLASPELNRQRGCVDYLDPKTPTVTRLLRESGYATGHFGKWHLGRGESSPKPEAYGIDRYDACIRNPDGRVRSSERIADETIRFIKENQNSSFYINAWLYDPHSPLHPTDEMMDPYADLAPRWGDRKGAMQIYYGVLSDIDKHVGRILDALDEAGVSDNTVVVFSSDNGPESGLIPFISHYGGAASNGPFRGIKRSLYEGGIRTPFIVRWPAGAPAGRVDNSTVIGAVDLLPTFLGLAGVDLPSQADVRGENLAAAFRGEAATRTRPLMWENRFPVYDHVLHKSPIAAIRDGQWKLLYNPDGSRTELYDIPRDPSELNNLAAAHPDIVKRLRVRAVAWQETLPEGPIDSAAGKNDYPWPAPAQ